MLFLLGILALAGGAFYTALIVATQIDHIFFPDSEIHIGGLPVNLPLIDTRGTSGLAVGGGRINVLVMGIDRRPSDGNAPTRTDTMFVMTIDPSTRTARGLAMPRDLYVDIPTKSGNSTFKERINAAYVYGETQGYAGGGAGLAKQTVEKLLGIKINYYVMIDFEGFKQVIELLGGVDIDVPSPGVNDPFYSETERLGDFYPCVFQPGLHHMNGSEALCYARVRRNSSDLDRILRQQRIILAVMDKVTQLNVLASIDNVGSLWKRYKGAIQTDILDAQLPGFARLAAAIDPDQLAFLSLGAATTPTTTPEGAAVLVPSEAGIKQIVDAFISDNRLLAEAASIEVQNGTGVQEQASKAAEYFTSLGVPHTSVIAVNAAVTGQTKTEIIDFANKPYTAERLAAWMSIPKDRVRKSTAADMQLRNSEADIVVILGSDAKIETGAVAPAASQPGR
jgi:polyisoprenyl-teichoic acid--peptidoglycan teichoic acid transferase